MKEAKEDEEVVEDAKEEDGVVEEDEDLIRLAPAAACDDRRCPREDFFKNKVETIHRRTSLLRSCVLDNRLLATAHVKSISYAIGTTTAHWSLCLWLPVRVEHMGRSNSASWTASCEKSPCWTYLLGWLCRGCTPCQDDGTKLEYPMFSWPSDAGIWL